MEKLINDLIEELDTQISENFKVMDLHSRNGRSEQYLKHVTISSILNDMMDLAVEIKHKAEEIELC